MEPDRPEGAVRHRRHRWDRRWVANLTRVRFTFKCVLSRVLSFFPVRVASPVPSSCCSTLTDTRYLTSRNFTCVPCQTSLRNRCTRHRHSHSGETKLPSSNTVDSVVDSWEYRRTRAGSRERTKLLGFRDIRVRKLFIFLSLSQLLQEQSYFSNFWEF